MPATAGIHLVARLAAPWKEEAVVNAAREASIGLYGIGAFHAGERREQGMLFGYGGMDVETVRGGVAALAALMPTLRARRFLRGPGTLARAQK